MLRSGDPTSKEGRSSRKVICVVVTLLQVLSKIFCRMLCCSGTRYSTHRKEASKLRSTLRNIKTEEKHKGTDFRTETIIEKSIGWRIVLCMNFM